jgi:hypothetical protein
MDQEIDEVVTEHLQPSKIIVKTEGEKSDVSGVGQIPEVGQVLDLWILDDVGGVIKQEGDREGVGVGQGG